MKEDNFKVDPRYKQAAKEAWIGIGVFLLNIAWWFAFAFGLGTGPPEKYTYIFGFPAWFFGSVIGSFVVFSLVIFLVVKYIYKDMPLDEEVEQSRKAK